MELKEVLSRPEYAWLEQYKDRLCFLCYGGSHAYGTNVRIGCKISLYVSKTMLKKFGELK